MYDDEKGKRREKFVEIVHSDKIEKEKTKEKMILSPLTCDTSSVSSIVADEKPRYSSDPNDVVELRPEDPTGRMPRTGNQMKRNQDPDTRQGGCQWKT